MTLSEKIKELRLKTMLSNSDIARILDCSSEYVRQIAPFKQKADYTDAIIKLRDGGYTPSEIAQELHISRDRVTGILGRNAPYSRSIVSAYLIGKGKDNKEIIDATGIDQMVLGALRQRIRQAGYE